MAEAASQRNILIVLAAAGAGKTTAIVQFTSGLDGPFAWLALDEADNRPGRFVSYLAAAFESIEPDLAEKVRGFLRGGVSPEDCAALLGEAIPPGGVLVIDDLHHIEGHPPVIHALRSCLRALAPNALVVLASRRIVGSLVTLELAHGTLNGRAACISDRDLAFQVEETAELLDTRRLKGDPISIQKRTGGWAAGIVFDAFRATGSDRGPMFSPEEDQFFTYLGEEIVDALPADLRHAVLRSGVLGLITQERLVMLLGDALPANTFARISGLRLPGTLEPEGLRYHPCFREYLIARLERDAPEDLGRLHGRLGRLLADEGFLEEAVDALLTSGDLDEAGVVAQRAVTTVMGRGDWDKVLEWCNLLKPVALRRHPALRGAQIRSLLMSRRQREVEWLVKGLESTGELRRLVKTSPGVASWAIWAMHAKGDWRRLEALLPEGSPSRRVASLRYILRAGSRRDPSPSWADAEFEQPFPLHVALQFALYYEGRFREVELMAGAAEGHGSALASLAQIWRVAVLRTRGDLPAARRTLDAAVEQVRASRFVEYWQLIEGELCFDEGDHEKGLGLVRAARETSRHHGYTLGDRGIFAAVEGRLLVEMGRHVEAIDLLQDTRQWCELAGVLAFQEWAEVWLAAGLLGVGGDLEEPLHLLRSVTTSMQKAGRRLYLPVAAVLLAEAEWRAGNEDNHDDATDLAYAASVQMGSLAPLRAALRLAPAVLARRLDTVASDDVRWRAVLQSPGLCPGAASSRKALLVVHTFGLGSLEVDGRAVKTTPNAVEVAAIVAAAGSDGIAREALLGEFSPRSRDARNYLRQLVHHLRRSLPEGLSLASDRDRLVWSPVHAVVRDDDIFESLLARARHEHSAQRGETLREAIDLASEGDYLRNGDSDAVRNRRRELLALLNEAQREYGRWLLEQGRPQDALKIVSEALRADAYREDGWHLLMRAEAVVGGPDAMLAAYLRCESALREVGLTASPETVRLLGRLRGQIDRRAQERSRALKRPPNARLLVSKNTHSLVLGPASPHRGGPQ